MTEALMKKASAYVFLCGFSFIFLIQHDAKNDPVRFFSAFTAENPQIFNGFLRIFLNDSFLASNGDAA